MRGSPWDRRPVVYRCYSADGELLYIGSTSDLDQRMEGHQYTSFWRAHVARVRIQIAPDRFTARAIEAAAIRGENPRFNIQHRRPRSEWTEQDYRDVIRALGSGPSSSHSPAIKSRIDNLTRQLSHLVGGIA